MNIFTQQVITIGYIKKQASGESVINIMGTGFFISNDKVVTTLHLLNGISVDIDNIVILMPDIGDINQYQDITNNRAQFMKASIFAADPFRDLAILELKEYSFSYKLPEIGSFDDVNVSDSIELIGFPHSVEGRRVLTYQTTEIGAKILLESHSIQSKHAVINTQSRPGLSGSLVFSRKINRILGVLIGSYAPDGVGISLGGINPRELHQTTHCISAEYIKEMI